MRITSELLRLHCPVPLEEAEYLDLSNKDIVIIERLSLCRAIRALILSNNIIKAIQNVDCCKQLWKIDLSGNRLKSLYGLSRFPALGFVCLGGNELEWQEMHRISHIIILSLTLKGNSKLDSDPYYRHHAVDLLPNVWMLDGQIVTAQERREVEDFFNESQSSLHPVRKKSLGSVFVPTQLKNLLVNGVFGDKTAHLMLRFPINYVHNSDMDKKRLSYLIYSVEDDMRLAHLYHDNSPATLTSEQSDRNFLSKGSPNLQCLFELRVKEVEQCNMLLLLMLASLEYSIPLEVLHSTLVTAKLTAIGDIQCSDLFLLPQSMILDIASLLLSATTVDRLDGKEGGLYDQLYKSLCLTMESVQMKKCDVRKEEMCTVKKTPPGSSKYTQSQRSHTEWNCLLAAEVVHLMCLVPQFFESLQTNEGLLKMTAIATKNSKVSDTIDEIVWKVQIKGGSIWETYQDIASYLLQATSDNGSGRKRKHALMKSPLRKASSQLLHPTQPKPFPPSLRAMSAGETRVIHRRASKTMYANREPGLGDVVVLNDQVARIIALPESRTAVLQINGHSNSTPDNPDSYLYTDTSGLLWDYQSKNWTKDTLASDFSFSHLSDSSCTTLPTLASITSLNESTLATPQTATPPPHRLSRPTSRPLSGMSHRSDDLQTIPSQQELIEESQGSTGRVLSNSSSPRGVQSSPIKVELGSSTVPLMDTVASENDHQNHVLQQYSLNQTRTTDTDEKVYTQSSPRSQALQLLRKSTREAKEQKSNSENDNLSIPSLQLHLTEMWESEKSLPTTISHVRSHSCKVIELDRQNLKIEPHMPPTPVHSTLSSSQTLSPSHISITENTSTLREKPVLYNAWTVAKPGTPTKQSTTRLMQKRPPKTPPLTLQNQGRSGTGAVAILRSKPEQTNQRKDIYSGPVGKYHYHHPRTRTHGGQNVRKLCRTKTPDFLVGNIFKY